METITLHNNWYIKALELPHAEEYISDINNISFATTGFIHAWESNLFFEEACQLVVNAIRLFQHGYFDCAFYSLRQSIETSVGIIYLTANPDKNDKWNALFSGFESGTMFKWLKDHEPTFKDIREKMPKFFNTAWDIRQKMNKYIHKQGNASFYQVRRNPFLLKQKDIRKEDLLEDFESYLKVCIGAVAVYRLSIDALPVVLMDENMLLRSGDFITEPYSQEFVDKYIGQDNIEAFKTTQIYKDFCASLSLNEKQNEAVFNLIHWQYYDREKMDDYNAQLHLCTFTDRIAICLFTISEKISQVFVDGIHWYTSDVKSDKQKRGITIGSSYYEEQFLTSTNNYNHPYNNVYLSRCQINNDYTYFEHNEKLTENEIECVKIVATKLSDLVNQIENELSSFVNGLKEDGPI